MPYFVTSRIAGGQALVADPCPRTAFGGLQGKPKAKKNRRPFFGPPYFEVSKNPKKSVSRPGVSQTQIGRRTPPLPTSSLESRATRGAFAELRLEHLDLLQQVGLPHLPPRESNTSRGMTFRGKAAAEIRGACRGSRVAGVASREVAARGLVLEGNPRLRSGRGLGADMWAVRSPAQRKG